MSKISTLSAKSARAGLFYLLFLLVLLPGCNGAQKLAEEGMKHYEQEKYITALTFFSKALESNAGNSLALYGKGMIMLQSPLTRDLGRDMLLSSLANFKAGEMEKKAYLASCQILYEDQNWPRLLKIANEAFGKNYRATELYVYRGAALAASEGPEKARPDLEQTLAASNRSFETNLALGIMLAQHFGNFAQAHEILLQAHSQKPGKSLVLLHLAKTAYLLRKPEASQYLQQLLANSPESKKAEIAEMLARAERRAWRNLY